MISTGRPVAKSEIGRIRFLFGKVTHRIFFSPFSFPLSWFFPSLCYPIHWQSFRSIHPLLSSHRPPSYHFPFLGFDISFSFHTVRGCTKEPNPNIHFLHQALTTTSGHHPPSSTYILTIRSNDPPHHRISSSTTHNMGRCPSIPARSRVGKSQSDIDHDSSDAGPQVLLLHSRLRF